MNGGIMAPSPSLERAAARIRESDAPDRRGDPSDVTPSSWAVMGDAFMAVPETTQTLPPGFYVPMVTPRGRMLRQMPITTDGLIALPDPVIEALLAEFVTFWNQAQKFAEMRLAPKRGLLLWGPPGSGKTSAVQRMAAHMIHTLGGVCVMANDPGLTAGCLQDLRTIEPTRPLICVFEDLDAMCDMYNRSELLALLDGELQVANVVNVATTNYPERLEPRFANRPGRFDRIQLVGMPSAEARAVYFKHRVPEISDEKLVKWVAASDGWSVAHLRELVVATEILGDPVEATIDRLSNMHQIPNSDRDDPKRQLLGFR
jgi:energy-coupling factor transporter ATP-binding protein EcfA2